MKHGQVDRESGVWIYTDRLGKETKSSIGPFRQVSDSMHSLMSYLKDKTQHDKDLSKLISKTLFGWGVMFTGLDEFHDAGPEAESWQIYTRAGLRVPMSHYINGLGKGFHRKYEYKGWYHPDESRPTRKECQKIFELLRGDFHHDYSSLNQILDLEELIETFTREQFETLDILNYNDRCLITGGAGTGKTLMAVKKFVDEVESQKKVALLCFNRLLGNKLAKHIQKSFELGNTKHYVGSLHSLMIKATGATPPKIDAQTFFENDLPLEFLLVQDDKEEKEKFDFLIVDESQDLMKPNYMEVFDSILKKGINKGRWVMFGDFSNQLLYESNPERILETSLSSCSYVRNPPLKTNCRNTKNIVLYNHNLTNCEMQQSPIGMIQGDYVEHYFPVKNKLEVKLEEIISNLLDSGTPMEKITVLSATKPEHTNLLTTEKAKEWIKNGLEFVTVQSYKGLENSFIILTGFEELDTDYATSLLYVGISRARLKLFLILKNGLEKSFNKLLSNNIS